MATRLRALLRNLLEAVSQDQRAILKSLRDQITTLGRAADQRWEQLSECVAQLRADLEKVREELGREAAQQIRQLEQRLCSLEKGVEALRCALDKLKAELPEIKEHQQRPDELQGERQGSSKNAELQSEGESAVAPLPERESATSEQAPEARERRGREPIKRGGRPRPRTSSEAERPEADKRVPPPGGRAPRGRPEVLCKKRGREWNVVVMLPDELQGKPELAVSQAGQRLEEEGGLWPLPQLSHDVTVTWRDGPHMRTQQAFKGLKSEGLLFKLDSQLKTGRQVHMVSRGWYLAIVPEGWERPGSAPIAPEPVAPPGYRAHYFDLAQEVQICFRAEGEARVPWQRTDFELEGEELRDGAERLGPLFKEPPRVRAPKGVWDKIEEVVIGEEGPGRGRWKISFHPMGASDVQTLPEELAKRRGGWYFLRFYDRNWDLVDSLDFRFLPALKAIQVDPPGPLVVPGPESGSHQAARVTFHHTPDCYIKPVDELPLSPQRQLHWTIARVPPDPKLDHTHWRARSGNAEVDLEIYIPRIWWLVGLPARKPQENAWQARKVALTREDFAPTSDKALWVRLPAVVKQLHCGFPGSVRRFHVPATADKFLTLSIRLREFTDAEPLRTPGRTSLQLRLHVDGYCYTTEVGELEVKIACGFCEFAAFEEGGLLKHVLQSHGPELYKDPTYEEIRRCIPGLPACIYKCSYCDEYVEAEGLTNPTTSILSHIDQTHKDHTPSFRIVHDPEEIRSNIEKWKDLPRFAICKLCNDCLDRQSADQALCQHVQNRHWGEVTRLI